MHAYIYLYLSIYKHTMSLYSQKWKRYQRLQNIRIEKVACFEFYRYTKIDMRDIIMKQSDQATI